MAVRNKKESPKLVPEYKCKRCKKSTDAWIEQILLKIENLEFTVKYLYNHLNITYGGNMIDMVDKECSVCHKKIKIPAELAKVLEILKDTPFVCSEACSKMVKKNE